MNSRVRARLQIIRREHPVGLALLPVYPVVLLLAMPVQWARTLWASRVLADGRWSRYSKFAARNGIHALFYASMALQLDRYGRSGVSPHFGIGDYRLSRWFHLSLFSINAFWRMAAILTPVCMLAWLAMHAVWIDSFGWWVALVLAVAGLSSSFYALALVKQNYNAVGWALFPLGVYGLYTGADWLSAIGWLGVSFGSFTAVVVAAPLAAVAAIGRGELWPILAIVPAGLKLCTHFGPAWKDGSLRESLGVVSKGVGASSANTRYRYTRLRSLNVYLLYKLALLGQFIAVMWWVDGRLDGFLVATAGLMLFNGRLVRFADVQTMDMLVLTLATAATIQSGNPWVLASFWLTAAPVAAMTGIAGRKVFIVPPALAPFEVRPLIEAVEQFLAPVQRGERVYFAHNDPQGVFENIFDGYRTMVELPVHVAARREFMLFPNWWAVHQVNRPDAPSIWGRDIDQVRERVACWRADFVLMYLRADETLSHAWTREGYRVVGELAWDDHRERLGEDVGGEVAGLSWWLLKAPSRGDDPPAVRGDVQGS